MAPTDLLTLATVLGTLLAVAVAAAYQSARRALRMDPLTTLKVLQELSALRHSND